MCCVTENNLFKPEIAGGVLACPLQGNPGDGLDFRAVVSK